MGELKHTTMPVGQLKDLECNEVFTLTEMLSYSVQDVTEETKSQSLGL